MTPGARRGLLVIVLLGLALLLLGGWLLFGWRGAAVVGAAATVGAAVQQRRSASSRHRDEVRGGEALHARLVVTPEADTDDTQEQLRRLEDRAARRRGRGTGQAP